jgi:hypothetical protein
MREIRNDPEEASMTRRAPFARSFALLAGAVALVAALAFAGPASAHHGGDSHGEPAGTIASFDPDTGVLTIQLSGGGTETGVVTERTWISSDQGCGGGHHGWSHGRAGRRNLHGDFHGHGGFHGHHWGRHGHGDWHHGAAASTADLTPGAVVDDAVLILQDGQAWFAKIDLESTSSSSGSPSGS